FQAEDGIRDFHVTGVQTCALPIFRSIRFTRLSTGGLDEDRRCSGYRHRFYGSYGGGAADQPGELMDRTFFATCPECRSPGPHHRSEERRVGKEGSSRRATET